MVDAITSVAYVSERMFARIFTSYYNIWHINTTRHLSFNESTSWLCHEMDHESVIQSVITSHNLAVDTINNSRARAHFVMCLSYKWESAQKLSRPDEFITPGWVRVEPLVCQPTYHQKSKCHTISLEIVFARAKSFPRNDVVAVTRPGYIPLLEFIVDAKINITSNDQIQSFSLKHKQIDARARCSRVAGWIRWNWSGPPFFVFLTLTWWH